MNYIEILETCTADEVTKEEILREIYQKREELKMLEKLFQAEHGKVIKGKLNKKLRKAENSEVFSAAAFRRIKKVKKPVDVRSLLGLFQGTRG